MGPTGVPGQCSRDDQRVWPDVDDAIVNGQPELRVHEKGCVRVGAVGWAGKQRFGSLNSSLSSKLYKSKGAL